MQRVIVRVSGRRMVNVVPTPAFESTEIVPLSRLIFVRTISMPTPRPEMSETVAAVLKPG